MASLYTHLLLLFYAFTTFGSCYSFRRTTLDHEFPVLRLDRRVTTGSANQTNSNNTIAESYVCKFTEDYMIQAAKANCSAYIEPLELTTSFQPWERYETANSFANCTYHQIATRFPDIPNGIPLLAFRDGSLIFTPQPNMADARIYAPRPPIKPPAPLDQLADQVKATDFLPILKDATEPFFRLVAGDNSGTCSGGAANSTNTTAADISRSYSPNSSLDTAYLLQSIEIATHQYTRCAIQEPSSIEACTVSTVSKLGQLPSSLFIYFGSPQCDSKLWSFVGVGLSILLEFLHLAALMYLRQSHDGRSFSWLQFLIKLVSGLGEPAIQAVLLQKANGDTSSGFVLASMEFLQPTAAPLLAAVAGWWFSKGHGFQVLATDAFTTLFGLVMILGFTSMQIAFSAVRVGQGQSLLVLIGLICAVGPWVLTYLLIGCVTLPMQLGFILGMIEMCAGSETSYGFTVFFMGLGILVVVVGFVAATPLFAIWEAIWVAIQKKRKWKGQTDKSETGEKPLFPLARWFRHRFQNTSRLKRGLVKFVFWLFILMSLASFVGKWMLMVNILTFAGDAYCPSGYKDATFAGLGFKAGILSFSIMLQFFGLTA